MTKVQIESAFEMNLAYLNLDYNTATTVTHDSYLKQFASLGNNSKAYFWLEMAKTPYV